MPTRHRTELTPELIEEFGRLLQVVLYLETVADYLVVERTTWRNWLKLGKAEAKRLRIKGGEPLNSEVLYLEFFNTYKRAIAAGEIQDAEIIKAASQCGTRLLGTKTTTKPDGTVIEEKRYAAAEWTSAAWRSERRFPKHWGSDRRELARAIKLIEDLEKKIDQLQGGQSHTNGHLNGHNGHTNGARLNGTNGHS